MNETERRVAVVIEDDADIRQLLEQVLGQAGFSTYSAANGVDGVAVVREHDPLVTTLDVSMPGMDGFETAKRIRTFSSTYLIMLTARNEEIDTLQGLESGADDYITKPFRPRELRARVEAMLRRPRHGESTVTAHARDGVDASDAGGAGGAGSAGSASGTDGVSGPPGSGATETGSSRVADTATGIAAGGTPQPEHRASSGTADTTSPVSAGVDTVDAIDAVDEWLRCRELRLHDGMRLVEIDGARKELTRSEFDLLRALMGSGRRVRSKADLALMVRQEGYITSSYVSDADKRAIEVHLANLRRKLGESASAPRWIETVRGVGYRMTED